MKLLVLAAVSALLSACAVPAAVGVYGMVEGASFLGTGKTATDHAISAVTERDCMLLRGVTEGKVCDDAPAQDKNQGERAADGSNAPEKPTKGAGPAVANAAAPPSPAATAAVRPTAAPVRTPPRPDRTDLLAAPSDLWTLVLGTFEDYGDAIRMVRKVAPERATITTSVINGTVVYKVNSGAFPMSEARTRRSRISWLNISDISLRRICPVWMKDDNCIVMDVPTRR